MADARSAPSSSRSPPCSRASRRSARRSARGEPLRAQSGMRPTILFVDEVHRVQQGAAGRVLPWVEQGVVITIGATTENPSFGVNSALLSRAAVYLEPLSADDLGVLFDRAIAAAMPEAAIDAASRDALVAYADGDGRRLVNLVEQLAIAAGDAKRASIDLRSSSRRSPAQPAALRQGQRGVLRPDLRAPEVGARLGSRRRALLARAHARRRRRPALLRAAADPDGDRGHRSRRSARDRRSRSRRSRPTSGWGSPEGELALAARCAIYLAVAPKSNAAYVAYGAARAP